ncbi:MAG: hypothetical protein LBB83_12075 [Treponema sp.]|jgi:hypothetical protein|nr:hypothetical protein [Treponema sp.]
MEQNDEERENVQVLSDTIDALSGGMERKAVRDKGTKGVFSVVLSFIKSYRKKAPDMSPAEWLEAEYAKPENAAYWKDRDPRESAQGIIRGIQEYEAAKQELQTHFDKGGSRETWLAAQIELGAEANGVDPNVYAEEIARGLEGAVEENAALLLEARKEAQ